MKLQNLKKLKEKIEPSIYHGIIAQELDKKVKEMNYNFGGIKNNNDNYTIGYTELITPLIKAIQELTIKNNELYNNNVNFYKRINKLE